MTYLFKTVDCGHRRLYIASHEDKFRLEAGGNADRYYSELPRYYKTLRGAKQGAALLTGERLNWRAVESGSTAKDRTN